MVITVAGEKKEVKDGLTLPELIEQENRSEEHTSELQSR